MVAIIALSFGACGTTASPRPSAVVPTRGGEPSRSASAPVSAVPFAVSSYPVERDAPCGRNNYAGNLKQITARDERTVVFELCSPDVAFLTKIASPSLGINDSGWLEAKIDPGIEERQAIVEQVNGTGPYKLQSWSRGSEIVTEANLDYWGEAPNPPTLIFLWNASPAERLREVASGTVDGVDDVAPEELTTLAGNAELKLEARPGLNVMYLGMNNHPTVEGFDNTTNPLANELVRVAIAMGIDRDRISGNINPPGTETATHFTPCAIPNGCAGEDWYEFDAAAATALLADAGYAEGFETTISYPGEPLPYVPDPVAVARDLQQQLKNNLNVTAALDERDAATYAEGADQGRLTGLYLLDWGGDLADVTMFLAARFGSGAPPQFGDPFEDITTALAEGALGKTDDERRPAYVRVNDAIKKHAPMVPLTHAGSGVAYRFDVEDTHAAPLGNESFALMTPGTRPQLVFMQRSEPGGLYCADESDRESFRVCAQMTESLYAHAIDSTAAQPALAESCTPDDTLTTWTCTLREATFHDGATLDASDVVLSYAVQWDAAHELHRGRSGTFSTFSGLFGGFLNAP